MRLSNVQPLAFLKPKGKDHGLLNAVSKFNPIRFIASVYVEVFRATPLLVQLFIVYHVLLKDLSLPYIKLFGFIRFERMVPGVIALSLNSGAYLSEIIRSGIQSVELGQTEAARSLGMNRIQTMRYIVLPQAIKNILPAIANEFVTIIKESSICFTIGVQDLMAAVKTAQAAAFAIAEPLILAAARALYQETNYDAETIARKALKIASEICVFTNDNIRCEIVGEKDVNSTLPPANEEKTPKKRTTKSKREDK